MIDYILHIGGRGGSGKTTLMDALNTLLGLEKTKNFTSRKPRFEGEGGYYFVDEEEFIRRFRANEVIECYFRRSNNAYYGLPASTKTGIVQCEIMGLIALKKWCFQHDVKFLSIYLDVQRDILYERIKSRGDVNETPEARLREDEYYELSKSTYDIVYDYNNIPLETGIQDILRLMREHTLIDTSIG